MNYINSSVYTYLLEREAEFDLIPLVRKEVLNNIGKYIQQKFTNKEVFKGIIICTHNSRRSHLGQVMLGAAAAYYEQDKFVKTYSGGTEATAVYSSVIRSLMSIGFRMERKGNDDTDYSYSIAWKDSMEAQELISKKYSSPLNPVAQFAAIMVCHEADEACPFVAGAEARFSLPYRDPKMFDGTAEEFDQYDRTCKIIGREMLYIMKQVST